MNQKCNYEINKPKLVPRHRGGSSVKSIEESLNDFGNTWLGKLIMGFGNAQISGDSGIGTAMATASGYNYNAKSKQWEHSAEAAESPEVILLRDNLAVLSASSPTHPATAILENVVFPGIAYVGAKYIRPLISNTIKPTIKRGLDYVKNLYNRYTAPKTNLTPNIYKGDQFLLMKDRLINGGFDKLGITPEDVINVPVGHPLYTPPPSSQSQVKSIVNSLESQVNARLFLLDSEPIPLTTEMPGIANYQPASKQFTSPTKGLWGKIDSETKVITGHEFNHAIDDVIKHKNTSLVAQRFKELYYPESAINLSRGVNNVKDWVTPPGFDGTKISSKVSRYFTKHGGTELNARVALLKNWFGITDPNQPITPEMWNYARRYYVKLIGADNNMQHMFRAVTDPKKFLDWINPRVASYVGITGLGVSSINNTNSNNEL